MKTSNQTIREIDLLDLFKVLLYKWRVIIAWMLILALVSVGYCAFSNTRANHALDEELAAAELEDQLTKDTLELKKPAYDATAPELVDYYAKNTDLTSLQIQSVKTALDMYDILESYQAILANEAQSLKDIDSNMELLQGYINSDSLELQNHQSLTSYVYNLDSQFKGYTSEFTVEQKTIFNEVKGDQIFDLEDASDTEQDSADAADDAAGASDEEDAHVSLFSGIAKKLILGLFLGIFLPCCWYGCIYIFDGRIKTRREFEEVYSCYCLGDITEIPERKGLGAPIDRLLDKIFYPAQESLAERQQMTIANIKAICSKSAISNVCISTSIPVSAADQSALDAFIGRLAAEGIATANIGSIEKSASSLQQMIDIGSVILCERPTKTKLTSMDHLATSCQEHNVEVLGVVCW